TPIHDVYGDEKRYEEVVGFFRNFFSAGLKDNPHLEKGVLTGILRVAKESMFSGLNNLKVHSLLRKPFATSFGFTEAEVEALCADFDLSTAQRDELRSWYNGYRFGGHVVYNPWSVLSYLDDAERRARPYWVNTGGDALIRRLLIDAGLGVQREMEALLSGGSIEKPVDEQTVLRDLEGKRDTVFSFLVMSGYLRADELLRSDEAGREHWKLSVPNKEVATVYRRLFLEWLNASLGDHADLQSLCRALLAGDASAVEEHLGALLEHTLSYHDTAGRAREVVYQAFVAGLLVALDRTHLVRSNRESGLGRCDVMITPRSPGGPGVALELKVLKASETMEEALAAALEQIRAKRYAAEIRAAGAEPVVELAAVFDKKRVRVARG
ncbi:MAG: AAA family ATPase, partial [Planctomycetes bacterium]|nr:AAA family ATPase [Planctomycetota bacterium]